MTKLSADHLVGVFKETGKKWFLNSLALRVIKIVGIGLYDEFSTGSWLCYAVGEWGARGATFPFSSSQEGAISVGPLGDIDM